MAATLGRTRIAVLGCGAVGQAFARSLLALPSRTWSGTLVLWSRSPASAAAALQALAPRVRGRVRIAADPLEAARGARIALLCVSEDGLAPLARLLGRAPAGRAAVWLVASGACPLEPLARSRGRAPGLARLHPLAPFPERGAGEVSRAFFGIEGDARGLTVARLVASWLDGEVLSLRPGAAGAYHAGAALLGGGLVALLELAQRILEDAVEGEPEDLGRALHRFAGAVAGEVLARGPARALSGPVARGSETTVRRHLDALRGVPEARDAYRTLGRVMLVLAQARGSVDPGVAARIERLLEESPGLRARPPRRKA